MITCKAPIAVKNKEKGLTGLTKVLGDLDTLPTLTKMIIGSLRQVRNGTTLSVQSFGYANFGGGITIRGIIEDQADIGWTNFLCGRWSVKWREAQTRHYLRMNKRKSAGFWVIAILKKLIMIRWDMWQFCNEALHSPTGSTSIASHHSLNYRISEKNA